MKDKIENLFHVHVHRLRMIWENRLEADDFDAEMMLFENELEICNELSQILHGQNIYPFWKESQNI